MKKLLLLLLLPLGGSAQDVVIHESTVTKNEICFGPMAFLDFDNDFGVGVSLSYFRNIGQSQVGMTATVGNDYQDIGHIAPTIIFNRRVGKGKSYAYLGGSAGFYYARDIASNYQWTKQDDIGYSLGVQGGYMLAIGNRFGIAAETGVRSLQLWRDGYEVYYAPSTWGGSYYEYHLRDVTYREFKIQIPVTISFRCRF